MPAAFACIIFVWCFSMVSPGSSIGQRSACACACPCDFAWLGIPCVGARRLSSISLSPPPFQGSRGLSSIVFFPFNSLLSVTGA